MTPPHHTPPPPRYYTVFEALKAGASPYRLGAVRGYSKQQMERVITTLKRRGFIKKNMWRTWEILKPYDPQLDSIGAHPYSPPHPLQPPDTMTDNCRYNQSKKSSIADLDRLHGVRVSVRIPPRLAGWCPAKVRAARLQTQGLVFKDIPQGQSLVFRGVRVWLCDTSLVLQFKRSFFADTSAEAVRAAAQVIKETVTALERHLGVSSFAHQGRYITKFSRAHHALIKNALAGDLDDRGIKLWQFRDAGGILWGQYDKSAGPEIDILGPDAWRNASDHSIFQNFFNYIREHPGKLEGTVEGVAGRYEQAFNALAEQIETHLAATRTWHGDAQDLGAGIASWQKRTEELGAAMRGMGQVMRGLKAELGRLHQKRLKDFAPK